jgi:nicotinamidase-related amidase/alkylated DNA repair dioxygenase AlkB
MLFERGSIPSGPPIETKKALLLIDFQNDFVEPDGNLPVSNVGSFLANLPGLVTQFREKGQVIWVGTEFLQPRSTISSTAGNHSIVLKQHIEGSDDGKPVSDEHDDSAEVRSSREDPLALSTKQNLVHNREAFLALISTPTNHRCCIAGSSGTQYPASLESTIDRSTDVVLTKSHYSAFEETNLLMMLRTRFITEVYICGSLSNIGVHATVLDAVCHGIKVTLIEDCLGYLDNVCHVEAMRRMVDTLGAGGVDLQELRDDLAGLLGDVIREEDFPTKFHVSMGPQRSNRSGNTKRQIKDCISNTSQNAVKPECKDNTSAVAKSDQADVDIQQPHDSPQPSPKLDAQIPDYSRKRSNSSLDPVQEDRELKSSQKPSDRRHSVQPEQLRAYTAEDLDQLEALAKDSAISPLLSRSRPRSAEKARRLGSRSPELCRRSPELSRLHPKSLMMDPSNTLKAPGQRRKKKKITVNILGLSDTIGSGDSYLRVDLLPPTEADTAFHELKTTIPWQNMYHKAGEVPRLVAVQGSITPMSDGTSVEIPIYRHPADASPELFPFTSLVNMLRKAAQCIIGHDLNHALIQYYRSSDDNISEHSDKTLDIVPGSQIVNISLGAQRTMVLRAKKSSLPSQPDTTEEDVVRPAQRIPLPHNSIFILGPTTNQYFLHSIRADRRPEVEKSEPEKAFGGERISLTFRQIGTFIGLDSNKIWGQGATGKTRAEAKPLLAEGKEAKSLTEELLSAFGRENHESRNFNWESVYGQGFDVLGFEMKTTIQEDTIGGKTSEAPEDSEKSVPTVMARSSDGAGLMRPESPPRAESAPF